MSCPQMALFSASQRCVRQRQAGAQLAGEGGAWAASDVAPPCTRIARTTSHRVFVCSMVHLRNRPIGLWRARWTVRSTEAAASGATRLTVSSSGEAAAGGGAEAEVRIEYKKSRRLLV